jgi:ABC-type glycerol-3-phosphate transport system substrate-binding protein
VLDTYSSREEERPVETRLKDPIRVQRHRREAPSQARLTAGIALLVAACSGATPSATSPTSQATGGATTVVPATAAPATEAPSKPETLTFTPFPLWNGVDGSDPNGQPDAYWKKLASDYTALHPMITINVEMGDWGTSQQTLTSQLAAGTPPDVEYMCDNNALTYEQYLVDMDPYIDEAYRADVTPATWDLYSVDGKVQELPGMVQWNSLIINSGLFAERNVPLPSGPERSWTWDQFMDAVRKLTFKRDDGSKVYGTAIAGVANASDVEWYNLHYLFNRGARFMDPALTKFTLNDQKGVDGLQWLLDLQDKEKVVPPGAAGLTWGDAWDMLYRGQIAMWHGAPWTVAQADGGGGDSSKLMLVQYPTFPGEPMVTDISSCGFGVFQYPDADRTAAAIEFAKYVTSTERLKDWKAGGYVPARLSAADGLYAGDANMAAYALMGTAGQHYWSRAVDILSYADPMNAILPSVLNHEATPKEALDKFVSEAQPIFDAGLASRP